MTRPAVTYQDHATVTPGHRALAVVVAVLSFTAAALCLRTLSFESTTLWADAVVGVFGSECILAAVVLLSFARRGRWWASEVIIAAGTATLVMTLVVVWISYRLLHPAWEGILEIG
jgi:tellurite resistance protein TehA-like permease